MSKLTIAKFGGSAIGIDGEGIPQIIKRIKEIQKNGKLVVVCSAPLTMVDGKKKSLTDVVPVSYTHLTLPTIYSV